MPNLKKIIVLFSEWRNRLKKIAVASGFGRVHYGFSFLFLRYLMCIPIRTLRHSVLRLLGMRLGEHSVIYLGSEIRRPSKIIVGCRTVIGHGSTLDGRGGLQIGSDVNLSSEVMIWTAQHDPQSEDFETRFAPVVIEDYAWVSCRCVILPGVTIGKGAVVAAGAVVTKSVDPFTIVAGIPATPIGRRNPNLKYHGDGGQPWFI